ncbi:MAG TPA: hypothetical protein VNZ05_04565 [Solirubrobacteraceae bacterium]|nr:hypothetical protein [Solirubrobacteraceae bacterium]
MPRRARRQERLKAPASDYADADGNVLTLRGSLTPGARQAYARALAGNPLSREDAWQRAVELLFELLATRWVIAGAPIERQRELLARLRAASAQERAWVRDTLRSHCAEHFPDVEAP